MDLIEATRELFASASRRFAVRLWTGELLPPAQERGVRGALVLATPRALDALLPPVSELRLAEAFLDGDLELEGDAVALVEAAALWEGPQARPGLAEAVFSLTVRRGATREGAAALASRLAGAVHSVARDRQAVRHHYDVSDDFYRLFLDEALVYSCAFFRRGGEESLEEAQRAKLDLVCRKLALRPGERLLDVGCGWGALLAHAAARHGAEVVGLTLSSHQLEAARRHLAGVPGARGEVRETDYRELAPGERFDKIASVGMMEHVGRAQLDTYFASLFRALPPGGLLLNHAIADVTPGEATVGWAGHGGGGFIQRYIFPDSDLVPLPRVLAAAERAGFEVRDVESLREHYARTLQAWLTRLEASWGEAERLVGTRTARAYRLYLASSAVAFRLGRISVFQTLLVRRDPVGRAPGLPWSREAWYAAAGASGER